MDLSLTPAATPVPRRGEGEKRREGEENHAAATGARSLGRLTDL